MKASLLATIAISIASQACIAQANFHYASGRLFADPETEQKIHSPYISYYHNDEQQWIIYDPSIQEGRFVSVSSTYASAAACGYVKGPFNLLNQRVVTPIDQYTGIAMSVKPDQSLEWLYAHNTGIIPSKFNWIQKLRDGMTVLSGHEYKADKNTGILLRIDKNGNSTWQQRIKGEIGLEVRSTRRDRIYWMTEDVKGSSIHLYELDQFTGSIRHEVEISEKSSSAGLRRSKTFFLDEKTILLAFLSTETPSSIRLEEYSLDGKNLTSIKIPFVADYPTSLSLQGVTKRPNGNLQLAMNLSGAMSIMDNDPIGSSHKGAVLLLTLDPQGNYLGYELYGNEFAGVNGIYHVNEKVAIVGCYEGDTRIQNRELPGAGEHQAAYTIYLEDFDPFRFVDDLVLDPTSELHPLKVSPSPVIYQDQITVLNEKVIPDLEYEIRIYDNLAKLQLTSRGKTRFQQSSDLFAISTLSPGLYHVFFLQSNSATARGKFIIAR